MSSGTRWDQIKSAERHGTGTQGQASDGTGASGNLPKYDGTGTLTDSTIPAANVALISKVQQESYVYAADTGTANAYAVTLSPAPTIVAGSEVVFKAANANTGASTLSVNGTIYPLTKNGATALGGGEIAAGQVVTAKFDGTNFQIIAASAIGNATAIIGSVAGQGKSSFIGTGSVPSGWMNTGFDDSAWNAPIQETGVTPGSPFAGTAYITDPSGNGTQPASVITLFRYTFSLTGVSGGVLQVKADNGLRGAWINGTQIHSDAAPVGLGTYSGSIPISSANLVVGSNLLAFEIQQTASDTSPTSLDFLLSLYGGTSGGGLTLETNGTPNGSQNILNLVAGSNVTLTDDGSGDVTITVSGGSVASVSASSPLQSSGGTTPSISFVNQGANTVLSGPSSGSAAAPSFRALVSADLPAATFSNIGAVKPDGTSITISGGVIATVGAGTSGVTGPLNPIFADTTPPTVGWSWIHQDSAVAIVASSGALSLLRVGVSGDTLRMYARAALSAPFTVTALLVPVVGSAGGANTVGIFLADSGATPKIASLGVAINQCRIHYWTNPTTFSGTTAFNSGTIQIPTLLGLRIQVTSGSPGNITYSISMDGGITWQSLLTTTVTTFLTAPAQYGLFVDTGSLSTTFSYGGTVYSWSETSP